MSRLTRSCFPVLALVSILGVAVVRPSPSAGQPAADAPSAASTASTASGASTGTALEDFHGAWVYRTGQGSLDDGIDRVADAMNLLIREIARGELHRRIRPERRLRFTVDGSEHVALTWDGWGPHRLALGTAARSLRGPDGSDITVTLAVRGGQLVQHHVGGGGARYTTYALDNGGQRLTMAVRITSDQLPVDLRYRLQYRRE